MTLIPGTIWCKDHFNCTHGSMTAMQRQNLTFAYSMGTFNPCFIQKYDPVHTDTLGRISLWDTAVVKGIVDTLNKNPEGTNFTESIYDHQHDERVNNIRCAEHLLGINSERPSRCVDEKLISMSSHNGQEIRVNETWSSPGSLSSSGRRSWGRNSGEIQTNMTCPRNVSTSLRKTSYIFLLERNASILGVHKRFLPVELCDSVTWDMSNPNTDVPYPTIVTDGKWWCNAQAYNNIAKLVFFSGAVTGAILTGWIADGYGRVPALVLANLLGAIGGALSVSTTNFFLFSFFRFITGMALEGFFTIMFILVLESCGPKFRSIVTNLSTALFFTIGKILLPVLAQWIGNWRIYGLAISLPMFLGPLVFFLLPESSRWLLSKGRPAKGIQILRTFAKVNRKEVPNSLFAAFEEEDQNVSDSTNGKEEDDESLLMSLKAPRFRRTFIFLAIIWLLINLAFDGNSRRILNIADENWNAFMAFTVASLTEFPVGIVLIFTLERLGRRWMSFGSLTLCGIFSIISAFVPENAGFTITLGLQMVCRFFINMSFNIYVQYTAELLPTIIRTRGINTIHIVGYVGTMFSPLMMKMDPTSQTSSLILLGGFALVGGFLSLCLPETLGEKLPNKLADAENLGNKQNFWNCPFCAQPRVDN